MSELAVVNKRSCELRWRSLVVDVENGCLLVSGARVTVSSAELGLAKLLVSRRNVPMSKAAVLDALFGSEHGRDPRLVDVYVMRLRRSLARAGLADVVSTVPGRGYAILDERADAATLPLGQPKVNAALLLAA